MSDAGSAHNNAEGVSPSPKLEWTKQVSFIMSAWADGAKSYRWLHEQAYREFKHKSKIFNIPVIILQAFAGFASVSMQGYVPDAQMRWAQLGVGVVNFIGGTLTTILNYYRFTQRAEAHYQAWVGWSRLGRLISNELSLEKRFRKDPSEFFKICKAEYERLMEMSPKVPSNVEEVFDFKFRGKKLKKKKGLFQKCCPCCCPSDNNNEDEASTPAKENKAQHNHLGIVFPDISDHITHTTAYEDKEETATQNRTPDFLVYKPPTPSDKKQEVATKWQLLRDAIRTSKSAEEVAAEKVADSLKKYSEKKAASPVLGPKEAPRLPPRTLEPVQVDLGGVSVKDRIRMLHDKLPMPQATAAAPVVRTAPLQVVVPPDDVAHVVDLENVEVEEVSVFVPINEPEESEGEDEHQVEASEPAAVSEGEEGGNVTVS